MKFYIFSFILILSITSVSCNNSNDNTTNLFPNDNLCDTAKVAFMINKVSPDSVARFICNSAIGLNTNVSIDSLHNAVMYAYNRFSNDDLQSFCNEFDKYAENLPLDSKMKLLYLAAHVNPDKLGYRLGLDYAMLLLTKEISLTDIDNEIEAFRNACGDDQQTYLQVLNGLSIALNLPEYSQIPKEVINKYGGKISIPYEQTPAEVGNSNQQ